MCYAEWDKRCCRNLESLSGRNISCPPRRVSSLDPAASCPAGRAPSGFLTSAQSLQQDNVRLAFILQADNQGNDYQGVTAPRALSHMRRYLSVKSVISKPCTR